MRGSVKELVQIFSETFDLLEPIYEFGALQVPGNEELANLRPVFPGKEYVGCDMQEGLGVDKVLNLHDIDLPDNSVGTVIAVETLEHVENPFIALKEIHRILKPGGIVLANSVMDFPIHDFPYDYWRYTPEAFRTIFKPFPYSFVGYAGLDEYPHTVFGLGFKDKEGLLDKFMGAYEEWRNKWRLDQYNPPYVNYTTLLCQYDALENRFYKLDEDFHQLEDVYHQLESAYLQLGLNRQEKELLNQSQVEKKPEQNQVLEAEYSKVIEYSKHVEQEYLSAIARIQELESMLRRPALLIRHMASRVLDRTAKKLKSRSN